MCQATKGNDEDLSLAFTNTGCHWRTTLYTDLPFDHPPGPVLTQLEGWTLQMVHPDILHIWHLGTGRDFLASALVVLIRAHYFPGRKIEHRLGAASKSLRDFAASNKLGLSKKKLTRKTLNWVPTEYPELKVKGYDTFIIGKWMSSLVEQDAAGMTDLATALWTSSNILSLMSNSTGFFLSEEEARQIQIMGELFCDVYLRLANAAILEGKKLFRTRPKFHLVQHAFMTRKKSNLNLHRYSTWLDEDANRRFMRVNRCTHKATAGQRVLECWLLGIPGTFAKLEQRG